MALYILFFGNGKKAISREIGPVEWQAYQSGYIDLVKVENNVAYFADPDSLEWREQPFLTEQKKQQQAQLVEEYRTILRNVQTQGISDDTTILDSISSLVNQLSDLYRKMAQLQTSKLG